MEILGLRSEVKSVNNDQIDRIEKFFGKITLLTYFIF